jgi:hypothetical protein
MFPKLGDVICYVTIDLLSISFLPIATRPELCVFVTSYTTCRSERLLRRYSQRLRKRASAPWSTRRDGSFTSSLGVGSYKKVVGTWNNRKCEVDRALFRLFPRRSEMKVNLIRSRSSGCRFRSTRGVRGWFRIRKKKAWYKKRDWMR